MARAGVRIAHLSDFHYDGSREVRLALNRMIGLAANGLPDVVVVTGDLSASGRPSELDDVARALEVLDPLPRLVIAGNRDLEPSTGPPGDAQALPADSDLESTFGMVGLAAGTLLVSVRRLTNLPSSTGGMRTETSSPSGLGRSSPRSCSTPPRSSG